MKIAIGKVGKSIKFGPESLSTGKKSMTAGSIDARVIFELLIRFNPQHTFYIVGRSNYSRLKPEIRDKINVHNNVVDLWSGFNEWFDNQDDKDEMTESWRYMDHVIESGHTFDTGIFIAGGVLEYAVQGKTLKNGEPIKTLNAATKYAAPIHHFINITKLPYVMLVTDPRCYPKPTKDLMVPPRRILSQYDEVVDVEHRVTYEDDDMVIDKVKSVYSGIESLYVVEEQWNEKETSLEDFFGDPDPVPERDINMVLFLNEGNPSRYEDLKKYILNDIEDVNVYGVWNDKALQDPRIEQTAMAELTHLFPRIRYTFCIPIAPGWATGKFWEMTKYGIIPFMHPSYDEGKNIGFPEELRVKDSKDLLEKISMYNSDKLCYNNIHERLQNMVTPDHKSGKFINDMVMKNVMEIVNED